MESVLDHYSQFRQVAINFLPDKADAEDLLQDTMLYAITHFDQYTPGTNLKAWLYTIMRCRFINSYRRKQIEHSVLTRHKSNDERDRAANRITSVVAGQTMVKPQVEVDFQYRDVLKAISGMESPMRENITLYMQGYQYKEIAESQGISMGTVKSSIHYARKKLTQLNLHP